MSEITIRNAEKEDAERLLEIYSYYVLNTAITFEYDVPRLEEFQSRILHTEEKYPNLVILKDGNIEGYAYAGSFVGRRAYDHSSELSIYIDHNAQQLGLGRKLYEALEKELKEMGILNLYACIGYAPIEDAYLTNSSVSFHAHMGFVKVGHFHSCGYKFDHWYDMIWMEKNIGEHKIPVLPVGFHSC